MLFGEKERGLALFNGVSGGRDVCYAVSWQIAMVCQGVETRARTALVALGEVGSLPGVDTRGGHELRCRVEGDLTLLHLLILLGEETGGIVESVQDVLGEGQDVAAEEA